MSETCLDDHRLTIFFLILGLYLVFSSITVGIVAYAAYKYGIISYDGIIIIELSVASFNMGLVVFLALLTLERMCGQHYNKEYCI